MTTPILRGPLHDELVAAMQRVPEIAGRRLTLTALTGGITNRNFRIDADGTDERWVIRLAGNDTHLLGISREVEHAATVAAAGVGVGPEVTAFIRPEGYLVTRFIVGEPVSDEAVHRPGDAPAGRRFAPADPRRPGHPGPVRAAADRGGVPGSRAGPRRHDPARVRPGVGRRPADRGRSPGRPDRAPAVPQRPAQRELHRRRARGSGSSTGSTRGWATRSSTSATSASTTS